VIRLPPAFRRRPHPTGQLDLSIASIRRVSDHSGCWDIAGVTFKAYSVQLLTKPWSSALGLLVLPGALGAAALLVLGFHGHSLLRIAVVAVLSYGIWVLAMAAAAAVALALVLVLHPTSDRRTAYLLTHTEGRACVLLEGIDTSVWEPKALAAWPRRSGFGSALGRAIIGHADAAGATMVIWCTRSLEATYARWGFTRTRSRLGMRCMQRDPRR
jgi:hypothetical protein